MSNIFETAIDVFKGSSKVSENLSDYSTNTGSFDSKSTWQDVWNASTDTLQKSLGMVTGGSNQELQAVSTGVGEATYKSIDKIENITKYIAIAGIIVVGLIIYSKLK